jgi:hypothetical protein
MKGTGDLCMRSFQRAYSQHRAKCWLTCRRMRQAIGLVVECFVSLAMEPRRWNPPQLPFDIKG